MKEILKEKSIFFLTALTPLLPLLGVSLSLSYINYTNCSDVFFYIDIARNIARGLGPVTSFNYYSYWPGVFYPALLFIQIGFSLFLSVYFLFFKSIEPLFFLNYVVYLGDAWLIYRIVKELYGQRLLALLSVLLIAANVSLQLVVLRVLTEPLSLGLFLWPLWLLLVRGQESFKKNCLGWGALLLTVNIFVRSALVFVPFVFFLSALFSKDIRFKFREAAVFLILPYGLLFISTLLVFSNYHLFPLQYPEAFKNFYLSTYVCGGRFFQQAPVCRPVCMDMPIVNNILNNYLNAAGVLFCLIRVFLLFAVLRIITVLRQRKFSELVLALTAIAQIALAPLLYYFVTLNEFEWTRFMFFPAVFLLIMGLKGFHDFCVRFFPKTKIILFFSVVFIILASSLYQSGRVLEVYVQEAATGMKESQLKEAQAWISRHTGVFNLVASTDYVLGGVDLDRPVVSIPTTLLLTKENMESFITIYRPTVFVFENTLFIQNILESSGYRRIMNRPVFTSIDIYERIN